MTIFTGNCVNAVAVTIIIYYLYALTSCIINCLFSFCAAHVWDKQIPTPQQQTHLPSNQIPHILTYLL